MKKILALVLAVVFMFALAIPAFAENLEPAGPTDATTNLGSDSGDVEVTYNVSGSYTVTIPSDITATSATATATVSAADVRIKPGQDLTVTVTSTNGFKLKLDEDDSFDYTIKVDASDVALANGGDVLVVNAGGTNTTGNNENGAATGSATLNFAFDSAKAKYQGQYSDTLTFTVTVATA